MAPASHPILLGLPRGQLSLPGLGWLGLTSLDGGGGGGAGTPSVRACPAHHLLPPAPPALPRGLRPGLSFPAVQNPSHLLPDIRMFLL